MKLRNIQLRSKEKSVKVQKKQSGAERMRKLREKKKAQSSLLKFFQSDKKKINNSNFKEGIYIWFDVVIYANYDL